MKTLKQWAVEQKPTALEELEITKTTTPDDSVEPNPAFLLLMVGALIFVAGMLAFAFIQNTFDEPVSDLAITNDTNITQQITKQHKTLALLELTDANVLFNELQTIKSGLTNLQVQHLCGVNQLVADSNELIENEQGSFVTYSCFARVDSQ